MDTRIVITDEADDEHYFLACNSGCRLVAGCEQGERMSLMVAASYARGHAIGKGHTVEIVDAR